MKLIYAANARIPSEKAHPYQILQMCEAFAEAGAEVTLLYAKRRNPHPAANDFWSYYGVEQTFATEQIPCLDLYPLAERASGRMRSLLTRLAATIQLLTYNIAVLRKLAKTDAQTIVYSRDPITLWLLTYVHPKQAHSDYFEAHTYPQSRTGIVIRRRLVRKLAGVVVITAQLADRFAALGIRQECLLVAHDGIRLSRFDISGDKAYWRRKLGWPVDAFIVGYLGRFYGGLEGMDKGINTLTDAVLAVREDKLPQEVTLALVGGPAEFVDSLRNNLRKRGIDPSFILYPGQVPPPDVPGYLRAFDVCVIPSHWNDFFAYYTSPLKLFEYMASGNILIATDLPSTTEVIQHEKNGLLVPPADSAALADAIRRARADPELANKLASQALEDVQQYTWLKRAQNIIRLFKAQQAQI